MLALDVGTSSARAAVYDSSAREIDGTQARRAVSFSMNADGGAELDADEAVENVARVVDEALARMPRELASQIEVVAVSCFWHSLVGVDARERALTPVLGWADTRAASFVEVLRERFDERATHARTGCRFHPSYWPAKLLWLRERRPELFDDTEVRWMSFADFLSLKLFGEGATSVSMASGTGLFDGRTALAWDEELSRALEIDREKQLPRLAADGETFRLKKEYVARWPSLGQASWFPAIGDGAANNLGAGCATKEIASLMVGTSAAMRVLTDEGEAPAALPAELWCYRADRRRVVVGGALSDGGGLRGWIRKALRIEGDAQAVEAALVDVEPDAHGLTVLPFWSGERSTGWHAGARGAILGLSARTSPLDVLRATMEAIAYRLAHISDALTSVVPVANIRASGGALRASRAWTQIIADALGRPLELVEVDEASSRGAVLLALEASGAIQNVSEISAPTGETFAPRPAHHARYREARERQQKFYELLIKRTRR